MSQEIDVTLLLRELVYLREKIQKTIHMVNQTLQRSDEHTKQIDELHKSCLEALQNMHCASETWVLGNTQDGT